MKTSRLFGLCLSLFLALVPCLASAQGALSDDVTLNDLEGVAIQASDFSIWQTPNLVNSLITQDNGARLVMDSLDGVASGSVGHAPPPQPPPPGGGHHPPRQDHYYHHDAPPPHHHHGHRPPPPPPREPSDAEVAATAAVVGAVLIASAASASDYDEHVFGFGIRASFLVSSCYGLGGGGSFYFKVRPMRWFSIELVNDYLVNEDLLRIPVALGVRIHAFDYAAYVVYGVVAGGVDVYSHLGGEYYSDSNFSVGGVFQIGGGASYTKGVFEIGLDMRYLLDIGVSRSRYSDSEGLIHTFLLSLVLGFSF